MDAVVRNLLADPHACRVFFDTMPTRTKTLDVIDMAFLGQLSMLPPDAKHHLMVGRWPIPMTYKAKCLYASITNETNSNADKMCVIASAAMNGNPLAVFGLIQNEQTDTTTYDGIPVLCGHMLMCPQLIIAATR
jgi:hypothetical protein